MNDAIRKAAEAATTVRLLEELMRQTDRGGPMADQAVYMSLEAIIDHARAAAPSPSPAPTTAALKRSCNRHDDCDSADARAKAAHEENMAKPAKDRRVTFPYSEHCHDDDCEDCFGR